MTFNCDKQGLNYWQLAFIKVYYAFSDETIYYVTFWLLVHLVFIFIFLILTLLGRHTEGHECKNIF